MSNILKDFRSWLVGAVFALVIAYVGTFIPNNYFDSIYQTSITLVYRDILAILSIIVSVIALIVYITVTFTKRTRLNTKREFIMKNNSALLKLALKDESPLVRSTRVTHWAISDKSEGRTMYRNALSRLISSGVTVRRLWQIQSTEDIKRLKLYIQQYEDNDNYNVKIILSNVVLIPEIMIINDKISSISFPNISNPRKIETAIQFHHSSYTSAIKEYFDVLWETAIPIKIGNSLHQNNLDRLNEQLLLEHQGFSSPSEQS